MQSFTASLIKFIHGHEACQAEAAGNSLIVSSEIVTAEGRVEREERTIPATIQAVREWLGY